ncbi:hypothetical protein [Burkholderia dolosa]|uniref:hypothetical protein n=1 Tax=Burkholderia dolosa TaxID=152500 RepID=UPI001B96E92D|nr:hypothetical protein [Burkholderia dolosa]MBR8058860.1 hypothetical protein [Burkholderia dolosa]
MSQAWRATLATPSLAFVACSARHDIDPGRKRRHHSDRTGYVCHRDEASVMLPPTPLVPFDT